MRFFVPKFANLLFHEKKQVVDKIKRDFGSVNNFKKSGKFSRFIILDLYVSDICRTLRDKQNTETAEGKTKVFAGFNDSKYLESYYMGLKK